MRICLIGDISGNIDEGMKKVTYNLYNYLIENNEVLILPPLEILTKYNKLRTFSPDIIHYVTGPSSYSFILLKLSKFINKKSKTIMSIIHPTNLFLITYILNYLKPDLALYQSSDMEELMTKYKITSRLLPNGVDTTKFQPIISINKIQLRKKYNIDPSKFIVLHVGNIRKGRNLELLSALKDDDIHVLIISSTTIGSDYSIHKNMMSNTTIITEYIASIQDIYAVSDLYVFPVKERPFSIDVPLSVLEALSCNLPVVTMRFGGLPLCFEESEYFVYAEDDQDFLNKIIQMKNKIQINGSINNRDRVLDYDWKKLGKILEKIYEDVINQ